MDTFFASLIGSMAAAFTLLFEAIPRILGFLFILIVGWIISGLLAAAVAGLLRAVRFNELANRSGVTGFIQRMGVARSDASDVLAGIVKWFVRLIVLVVAFDSLGLPAVSQVLQQFLLWIPNLVVAMVILVIAGLAANALSTLVRGSAATAGFNNPELLASIARIAVWVFAIVVAVNQLGIATTLVNTLFMGTIGAVALALALAFGLGGRETAARLWEDWYQRGRRAAPKLEEAGRQMEQRTTTARGYPSPQPSSGD